jgi:hypothetical protein
MIRFMITSRAKRRTAAVALSVATVLSATSLATAPAHADTVYHACRLVNGVETDGPLPFGWTAQPCLYLDYDNHTAQAVIDYHGGTTDVHLIAEIGWSSYPGGPITWGIGQFINHDTNPVGSGTIRVWSYNVGVPSGIAYVYARARLKESSVGIVGDVESGGVPPSW